MPRLLSLVLGALVLIVAIGAAPAAEAAAPTAAVAEPAPAAPSATTPPTVVVPAADSAASPAAPVAEEPSLLQRLLHDYGYLAILVGTFFEGETIVILAGIAAQQGMGGMNVWWVALCAFCGGLAGDTCWFLIGRRWGNRILARRPKWQARAQKVLHHVYRHRVPFVLSFRFFYGLRNVTPFALATTPMPMWYFTVLNAIGAAIWALSFAWGGYAIGKAAETYLHRGGMILLGIVALVVVVVIWRRRRARRAAAAAVPAAPAAAPPGEAPPPAA